MSRNPALSDSPWPGEPWDLGLSWGCDDADRMRAMAHLMEKETLLRANSALLLALVGGGLVACAVGAVVYDIGRMVGAW